MKKIMLLIVVMVIANMTIAFAQNYRVNDLITVDEWRWVDVVNSDEVLSANNAYSFGRTCGVGRGDELQVIGTDKMNYLLRVEKKNPAYGTQCPNGVLFFMDISTVDLMKEALEKKKAAEKKIKAKVERLVKKHREEID